MITRKQQRFVDEYLKDLNASKAAERASYKHPYKMGYATLNIPHVAAEVQRRQDEIAKRCEINHEWALKNMRRVFERSMQDEPVLDKNGEPTGEYKFDATNANRSLELIGKHLGMFKERVEHTGKDSQAIKYENITAADRTQRIDAILERGRDRRDNGAC